MKIKSKVCPLLVRKQLRDQQREQLIAKPDSLNFTSDSSVQFNQAVWFQKMSVAVTRMKVRPTLDWRRSKIDQINAVRQTQTAINN